MVHEPRHGRSRKHSKRNKRFLILCGGVVTEIEYFNYVKSTVSHYAAPSWEVRKSIELDCEGVDPLTLASDAVGRFNQDAKAAKDEEYDPYTCVWSVTDVDDFGNKLRQAQNKVDATSGKVKLIISNPCFEVWLIDHVRTCPEAYKETKLCQQLAKKLELTNSSRGHKDKHVNLDLIQGHYSDAKRHAKSHMKNEEQKSRRKSLSSARQANYAPWTDVPDVISVLIKECQRVSKKDITDDL